MHLFRFMTNKNFIYLFFILMCIFSFIVWSLAGNRFIHYCLAVLSGIIIYLFIQGQNHRDEVLIDEFIPAYLKQFSTLFTLNSVTFFIGFFLSCFILYYHQYLGIPIEFFLLFAFLTTLIFLNILITNEAIHKKIILFQIILIAFLIRAVRQIIYPEGTPSRDGVYHFLEIAGNIVHTGYVPTGTTYTFFPIMHILLAIISTIGDLIIWLTAVWMGVIITTFGVLLMYSITKMVFKEEVALIASTFYAIYPYLIAMGSLVQPITFTSILILLILYVLFKVGHTNKNKYYILLILLSVTLILTHHFSAIQYVLFLIPLCFFEFFHSLNERYQVVNWVNIPQNSHGILIYTITFFISLLVYWIYTTSVFSWGISIFKFFTDIGIQPGKYASADAIATSANDMWIVHLNELGFAFLIILIVIGILLIIRSPLKKRNFYAISLSLITVMLVSYIAFSYIFPATLELLPWRTFSFLGLVCTIIASIGLLFLVLIRINLPILIILFFCMAFLMASCTNAMADESPLLFNRIPDINTDLRPTDSSIKVTEKIQNFFLDTTILYYKNYIPWMTKEPSKINDIFTHYNLRGISDIEFKSQKNVILLQKERHPLSINGPYDHDFISKIYDSEKITIRLDLS